jgi:hypothetical protein
LQSRSKGVCKALACPVHTLYCNRNRTHSK